MAVKRIILWGGWYGSKNVGDQALLLSITDLLGEEIENVEFVVITDNPFNVREYTNRDSSHAFLPLHTRKQFFEIVKAFRKADLFISLAIAVLVTLSMIFHVPCVLWAVSSQRIHSKFTRLVLRYLLFYASVATYRDSHTHQLFQECGRDDASQQMAADPVFTLYSNGEQRAREILGRAGWNSGSSRPLVALTPRMLRGSDGEAHTHYPPKSSSDSQKEIEVFASVLDWLWENGYQPIFVPMNTVPPDDDRMVSRMIMERAKFGRRGLLIEDEIFPRDAANVYSHCNATFVARVHGSVTAFLGRCPMLMYAFDLKHGGIMEQIGLSRQVFNPETGLPEDAIEMMGEVLRSRTGLIAQMQETAGELQEQTKGMKDAVLRLLDGK